jgi:hypothetical protein
MAGNYHLKLINMKLLLRIRFGRDLEESLSRLGFRLRSQNFFQYLLWQLKVYWTEIQKKFRPQTRSPLHQSKGLSEGSELFVLRPKTEWIVHCCVIKEVSSPTKEQLKSNKWISYYKCFSISMFPNLFCYCWVKVKESLRKWSTKEASSEIFTFACWFGTR